MSCKHTPRAAASDAYAAQVTAYSAQKWPVLRNGVVRWDTGLISPDERLVAPCDLVVLGTAA